MERFAGDRVLIAKRGDRAAWCVIGPLGDCKADTGIDRVILIHLRFFASPATRSTPRQAPGSVTDV